MKQLFLFSEQPQVVTNDAAEMRISGYFVKYGQLSSDRGGYFSLFSQGVFQSLTNFNADIDISLICNHDDSPQSYLARVNNGTLTLSEDEVGGKYEALLANTTAGKDAYELIQRRDLVGCSFAVVPSFDAQTGNVTGYTWEQMPDGAMIQKWQPGGAQLFEVSLVFSPSISGTSINYSDDAFARYQAEQQRLQSLSDAEADKIRRRNSAWLRLHTRSV